MASCALVAAFCVGLPLTAADAHVRHVHKLKLGTHVDPRPPLPAHPRRHRRIARTSTFATTWGCTEQWSDLAPLLSDAPQIKVIYAYPHGATDQLATYGSMIQADADAIRAKFNTESSGAKMVRFDVGGTGGSCTADSSNRLDIQSVELAQPASFYLDNTFDTITAELASKLVPVNPHERVNYVVYLDNAHPSDLNIAGQGDLGFDTTHGYSNAVNQGRNGNGRLFALIYGTGGADFVGGHGDDDRRTSFAHEMSHTFGAVQKTAPHTSGAGHCFDVDDIMCYDDDGPYFQNGGLLEQDCASTGFTDLALDCGKTDYFNANPPGGSYLAINWNEFDSVFLCPVSECDNNLNDPNFKVTLTPTHPGGRLTLNADAGNVA